MKTASKNPRGDRATMHLSNYRAVITLAALLILVIAALVLAYQHPTASPENQAAGIPTAASDTSADATATGAATGAAVGAALGNQIPTGSLLGVWAGVALGIADAPLAPLPALPAS